MTVRGCLAVLFIAPAPPSSRVWAAARHHPLTASLCSALPKGEPRRVPS